VIGRLGRRYARAVLDLARGEGSLEATGEELGRALAVFEEPRLRPLLLSPAIEASARHRTARSVVEALRLSRTVGNLILLLAERDRLPILPDLLRAYEALVDDEVGRARVTIHSAVPLGAAEKSDLVELARRLTKRREVLATTEMDPDLLGGIVVDAGGTVYDGSVRAQLARLSKEMAGAGA
jgi:F-type H+-transporting ATPase subunit delta